MQFKDYYQSLGVPKTATQDEIKSAFRKLARKHHPDVVKASERAGAEKRFKEINEAYEVLGDPEKRRKYDTLGMDWERGAQPQPGGGFRRAAGGRPGGMGGFPGGEDYEFNFGGTGFSDFFEAFFSSGGRGTGHPFAGARGGGARKGGDVEADLMVPLEEALHGARRKISLQRAGGEVQTYEVKIPAGVREGQRIRLSGQGSAGTHGAAAGDLYLNVRLAPHPEFRVEGSDLIHELDAAPSEAVLGGEVSVPTMEGDAKLKLPAGSQPGQRFRLKNRGMPKAEGGRGDLYVVLTIEIPKHLTPKERELWEALAEEESKVGAD
ncbi:MAG: J domain-containing protein [Verrucomicrobiota bacterium]